MSNTRMVGFNGQLALRKLLLNDYMSSEEKVISITIALYGGDTVDGNPSASLAIDDIANLVNCSKSTASKIVKAMVVKGYVDCIRKGQGKPNIYVFKEWRKWQ